MSAILKLKDPLDSQLAHVLQDYLKRSFMVEDLEQYATDYASATQYQFILAQQGLSFIVTLYNLEHGTDQRTFIRAEVAFGVLPEGSAKLFVIAKATQRVSEAYPPFKVSMPKWSDGRDLLAVQLRGADDMFDLRNFPALIEALILYSQELKAFIGSEIEPLPIQED